MEDPSYELAIKQTLTIKPLDFYIRAIPRAQASRLLAIPSCMLLRARADADGQKPVTRSDHSADQPLYVLYGSNTGCCETFAQRIALGAASHGAGQRKTRLWPCLIILRRVPCIHWRSGFCHRTHPYGRACCNYHRFIRRSVHTTLRSVDDLTNSTRPTSRQRGTLRLVALLTKV